MTVSPTARLARQQQDNWAADRADLDRKVAHAIAAAAASRREVELLRVQLLTRTGAASRWRDCHSAAPPSTFSRCFNSDGERASAK